MCRKDCAIPQSAYLLSLSRQAYALLCVLLLLIVLQNPLSLAVDPIPHSVCLSGAYARSSKPSIATDINGDCSVAWVESNQTIMLRQRKAGNWLPQETLNREVLTDAGQPRVRLDSMGNSHVIWAATNGNQSAVEYAFQTNIGGISSWTHYGALVAPNSGRISSSNLLIDAQNQVFAIWQQSEGSSHRIHAFTLTSAGKTTYQVLAGKDLPGPFIYPDLLLLRSPVDGKCRIAAAWFNIQDHAKLEMSVWNPASAQWEPFLAPEVPDNIMQCLPLVSGIQSQICLIGYKCDPNFDRVFLNDAQNRFAWLSGPGNCRFPRICAPSSGNIGLVWQTESESGAELVHAALRNDGYIWEAPVAKIDDFLLPEPDVALSGKAIMTVWAAQSEQSHSPIDFTSSNPSSSIFFAESSIPQQGWRKIEYSTAK